MEGIRGVARELAIAYGLAYDDPGLTAVPGYDSPGWDVAIDELIPQVARTPEVPGPDPAAARTTRPKPVKSLEEFSDE